MPGKYTQLYKKEFDSTTLKNLNPTSEKQIEPEEIQIVRELRSRPKVIYLDVKDCTLIDLMQQS